MEEQELLETLHNLELDIQVQTDEAAEKNRYSPGSKGVLSYGS